jgi:DUF1680 family protein
VDSHELYDLGHLYEGAVAHYQATGKRTLLDVYAQQGDALYVNLFVASQGDVKMDGAGTVSLVQETRYPWSGGFPPRRARIHSERGA